VLDSLPKHLVCCVRSPARVSDLCVIERASLDPLDHLSFRQVVHLLASASAALMFALAACSPIARWSQELRRGVVIAAQIEAPKGPLINSRSGKGVRPSATGMMR